MLQVTRIFGVWHEKKLPRENYVSAETICLALNLGFLWCFWVLDFSVGGREEGLKRVWHSESQSQQIHICLSIYNQDNLNPLADVTELRHEYEFRKQYDPFVRKARRRNPNN